MTKFDGTNGKIIIYEKKKYHNKISLKVKIILYKKNYLIFYLLSYATRLKEILKHLLIFLPSFLPVEEEEEERENLIRLYLHWDNTYRSRWGNNTRRRKRKREPTWGNRSAQQPPELRSLKHGHQLCFSHNMSVHRIHQPFLCHLSETCTNIYFTRDRADSTQEKE